MTTRHHASPQPPGVNIPIPDPSILTTEALDREILALRELLEVTLGSSGDILGLMRSVLETRLDGMDKATKLLQDIADKLPARIDEKIAALREIQGMQLVALESTHGEKFRSIETQFKERDVRTEQSGKDSKTAVDAALQAAKEAVGEQNKSSGSAIAKSEASTMKQIDQLGTLIQAVTKTADDKISDLKDRIAEIIARQTKFEGRGEGQAAGTDDARHTVNQTRVASRDTMVVAGIIVTAILGVAGLLLSLAAFMRHA
jgi:hypothetical protein